MTVRVTQSDIARTAGVHNTTVSLALRNSPLIPAPTRERIHAIAQSLGYTPDPALRALATYRKALRTPQRAETLVYLTTGEIRRDWRLIQAHEQYRAGAERKAAQLGFQFRPMSLADPDLTPRRLDRLMHYEGIRCVLLAPTLPLAPEWTTLSWSRLCAVRIGGATAAQPELNQVALDAGAILRQALRRVRLAGYRRVGLVLTRCQDQLEDHAWSAAFHAEQYRDGIGEPPPVLHLPEGAGDSATLARWYRACRPDVILGLCPALPELFRQAGLRVPGDVAYADLFLRDAFEVIAGVRTHCDRIGEIAVEMLAGQLEQNNFGLPAVPTVTSVGGEWRDGASLPARAPAPSALDLPVAVLTDNLVA
jgi:LacI family transcriptional regulator